MEFEIRYDIMKWISNWVNNEVTVKGYYLTQKQIKEIVKTLYHERIHSRIYRTFGIETDLVLKLYSKFDENNNLFFCSYGQCIGIYPHPYSFPKLYPKYILIEFIQFLFDILYDIFRLKIFSHFPYRIKIFLKTIIKLKPTKNAYLRLEK